MKKKSLAEDMLTVDEAAAVIGVSRVTVYHYIKKGLIKSRKIGGRRRLTWSDIEAFLRGTK
jgi:excisionase family DNA binding protein